MLGRFRISTRTGSGAIGSLPRTSGCRSGHRYSKAALRLAEANAQRYALEGMRLFHGDLSRWVGPIRHQRCLISSCQITLPAARISSAARRFVSGHRRGAGRRYRRTSPLARIIGAAQPSRRGAETPFEIGRIRPKLCRDSAGAGCSLRQHPRDYVAETVSWRPEKAQGVDKSSSKVAVACKGSGGSVEELPPCN